MSGIVRDQFRASNNNETVAIRRTTSLWMTGDPTRYNSAPTATYTQRVLNFYQQQRRGSS